VRVLINQPFAVDGPSGMVGSGISCHMR
jgi:hypothetical protein